MACYSRIDPEEFTVLLNLLSQSSEFSDGDDDSVLALYQLRRECSIVHALSQEECDAPELALENDRRERIARTAGVTTIEVAFLVHRQGHDAVKDRLFDAIVGGWRITAQCAATHLEMARGKCPWCGKELFENRPRW